MTSFVCTVVHLVSSGESLVEGQPLDLNCSISGHLPTNGRHKIKFTYLSPNNFNTCCNDLELNESLHSDEHGLSCSCKLSAHSTLSDSGNYSCIATVDNKNISSDVIDLKVQRNWHTIIIAAAGSGSGLIVVLVLALSTSLGIAHVIRRRRRPPEPPPPRQEEGERLLDGEYDGIRENQGM